MNNVSKSLSHGDESGFLFAQEMLNGNMTAGINFDRLQKHPEYGYIIFEYLLCEESQPRVNPYTSHPRNYWNKNKRKFISLWNVARALKARLLLVNYAKKGTLHEDKVLLIEVLDMDDNGIKDEKVIKFTRKAFSDYFIKLNNECLESI